MGRILEDIRILDMTRFWFGPFCTMMLAELGAEVIRIEVPWGAVDRIADGALFGGDSYTFHHLNLNKKNLTINLKTPEGLEIFKQLVKISDVVVQNFKPGTMERLGLGYDVLKDINSDIIYAALSGFGQDGPYSDRGSYATIAEAMSGHTRLTGDEVDPEGPPIEMAQAYGDLGPALFAAMSIIAAIRHRDKTGIGQMIDVSQLDCMVALNTAITGYNLSGLNLWKLKKKYSLGQGFGGLMKTKNGGWIRLASFSPRGIDSLRKYLGVDELNYENLESMVSDMDRDDAVNFFLEANVPVAPVYQIEEVVEDPHLIARGMFLELDHPKAGRVKVLNFPVKFSDTLGEVTMAAPLLGQNNKEILIDLLGYDDKMIKKLESNDIISIGTY